MKARQQLVLAAVAIGVGVGCSKNAGGLRTTPGQGSLSPAAVAFGPVPVGDVQVAPVDLTNIGGDSLTVNPATLTGDSSDFRADGLAGAFALGVLDSRAFAVAFAPQASGALSASLAIPTGGGGDAGTLALPLSGVGIDPATVTGRLSVDGCLDFGTVGVGSSATRTLTLTNSNAFPVEPKLGPVSGPQATAFVVLGLDGGQADGGAGSDAGPSAVDAGAALSIAVAFTPQTTGMSSASLAVAPCQRCAPQAVCLTGSGLDGRLVLNPTAVDFGLVFNAPEPPPSVTVTATVTGDTPVYVAGIAPSSPNSVFSVQQPLPSTYQPDASFTFTVSYSPSGIPGGDRDSLLVTSIILQNSPNAAERALQLPVQGDTGLSPGCHLSTKPSPDLDFGQVAPGSQRQRELLLQNGGAGGCEISSLALNANSDPDYALGSLALPPGAATNHLTIASHGTLAVPVILTAPAIPRNYQPAGSLALNSDDPTLPTLTVPLRASIQSLTGNSTWPKWHHDAANTGQSEANTSQTVGKVLWSRRLPSSYNTNFGTQTYVPALGGYAYGPTLGSDGNLYQMGFDGTFLALDVKSGTTAWSFPLLPPAASAGAAWPLPVPTLAGNGSLFLALTNVATAIDINGQYLPASVIQFSPSAHQPIFGSPFSATSIPAFGPGGQVYVMQQQAGCGGNGAVGAFVQDVLQAPVSFKLKTCVDGTMTPAVDSQGNTFWCTVGTCFKADPQNNILWLQTIGVQNPFLGGSPVLAGQTVYYYSFGAQTDSPLGQTPLLRYHGTIYTLDASSPHPQPRLLYDLPPVAVNDPLIDANFFNQQRLSFTPSLAADGAMVFAYVDGLYCVDTQGSRAGQLRWSVPIPGGVSGNASLGGDGTAYVGTVQQGLLAIDLPTGRTRWQFSLPDTAGADGGFVNSVSSEPALADGLVYVTGDDGVVYAIQ